MLSWPSSSGKQQFSLHSHNHICKPSRFLCSCNTQTSPSYLQTSSDQNGSKTITVSVFHQASSQGTPSRHRKPIPELASRQQCLSKSRSNLHERARVLQPSLQTTANALQKGYGCWPGSSLAKRNPICNLPACRRMGQAHPTAIPPPPDFEGRIPCFFIVNTIVSKSKLKKKEQHKTHCLFCSLYNRIPPPEGLEVICGSNQALSPLLPGGRRGTRGQVF